MKDAVTRLRSLSLYVFIGVWVPTMTLAAVDRSSESGTSSATVTINLNQIRAISDSFFGHNIEYVNVAQGLCDSNGIIRSDILRYLPGMQVGNLRFPGGTLAMYYHWADGIGPRASRALGRSTWSPYEPYWPMTFGTKEFFAFAESIKTQGIVITVNVPTAEERQPWMGTAKEAAAWVAYCNATTDNTTTIGIDENGKDWKTAAYWAYQRMANGHAEPYNVKYWELGNEVFNWINDPAYYAEICCEFAAAMKAVDPTILCGAVAKDSDFGLPSIWNNTVLANTIGSIDFIVPHFYLPGINGLDEQSLTAQVTSSFTLLAKQAGTVTCVVSAHSGSSMTENMTIAIDGQIIATTAVPSSGMVYSETGVTLSQGDHVVTVKNTADSSSTTSKIFLHKIALIGNDWQSVEDFRSTTANDIARLTMAAPDRFRSALSVLESAITNNTGLNPNNVGIAITEYACNLYTPGETDNERLALIRSQEAAIYLADTLLAAQEASKVQLCNYWTLRGEQWDLIDLSEDGNVILQAPYFVYNLYGYYWQDYFCDTTVSCGTIDLTAWNQGYPPALRAGCSISKSHKRVAVMLINRALNQATSVSVTLNDNRSTPFTATKAFLKIMSSAPEAVNTEETPNALSIQLSSVILTGPRSAQCTIPPCSIGLLFFENR